MAVDVTASAETGSATPAEPAWRARWLIIARRAWPLLTVLAITANLLVLPEYTRSLLTRTIRAELPGAQLTPAEYVAIQVCYVAVFMLVCLAVATVIYVRATREPVALYCAYTLTALGCGFGFLAGLTITNPILNALSVIVTGAAQVTGGWLFLIFPSGSFVPRWSRWCALAATAGVAAVTVSAIARVQPAPGAAQPISLGLLLLGAGAQVYRYRRVSSLTERQQTKWVVSGLAAAMACIIVFQLIGLLMQEVAPSTVKSQVDSNLIGGVFILMLAIIPVCIGIAVLRTHLWDIGLVISRTLTYAVVTALLAGMYTGLVLLVTRVLPFHTAVAVAVSTLAAAAAFHPLRQRVQRTVDRRFNRARYDADQAVAAFAARLQDAAGPDAVHARLLAAVHQALEPARASIWINQRLPFAESLGTMGQRAGYGEPAQRRTQAPSPGSRCHRPGLGTLPCLALVRTGYAQAVIVGEVLEIFKVQRGTAVALGWVRRVPGPVRG